MLQDPKTSEVATELFLTDKYLPAKCLKMAFDKKRGLSNWRATLIAGSLLLEVAQVRSAFKKFEEYRLLHPPVDCECEVCGSTDAVHDVLGVMLLCGHSIGRGKICKAGYHQRCVDPPLDDDDIPLGEFYCPKHARH